MVCFEVVGTRIYVFIEAKFCRVGFAFIGCRWLRVQSVIHCVCPASKSWGHFQKTGCVLLLHLFVRHQSQWNPWPNWTAEVVSSLQFCMKVFVSTKNLRAVKIRSRLANTPQSKKSQKPRNTHKQTEKKPMLILRSK